MKTAADALHALMHNREYTLPALPWLGRSWEVERAEAIPSPHLRLVAGDALEVEDVVGLAWGLQVQRQQHLNRREQNGIYHIMLQCGMEHDIP